MNKRERTLWSVILFLIPSGKKRTGFIKRHHLYGAIGDNCYIQMRYLPLYSNLVFLHNNVKIASNVGFVTHDIIHTMLNQKFPGGYTERVGCIEVMDNVFIGSGTRILYNTRIGSNVVIGSDSLVSKDIHDNSVWAGVPARYICAFDEYVEKAKDYSANFKELYGIERPAGVSDELARQMYQNFLKDKEQKKG